MKTPYFKLTNGSHSIRKAANEFLDHLHQRGLSPRTVYHQYHFLKRFIGWCDQHRIHNLLSLTLSNLEAYQVWLNQVEIGLKETRLQAGSIQKNLQTIKRFIKWCTTVGKLFENPAVYWDLGISKPSQPSQLTECLTETEINKVLSFPDPITKLGLRDKTILEVFYSTGIRKSELIHLDLADIDFTSGIVNVRKAKGSNQRLVPIGERALEWTKTYLKRSRSRLEKHPHPALFLAQGSKRIGTDPITQTIRKAKARFQIQKWGNAHLIRHTMATLMLKNGADLRVIQEILGHSNIQTTTLYTHLDITHLKKIHQQTHPAEQGVQPDQLF